MFLDRPASAHHRTRRAFLQTGTLAVATFAHPSTWAADAVDKVSLSEAFDREMEAFMAARKIPGGALAVVKDRRLVLARGYG